MQQATPGNLATYDYVLSTVQMQVWTAVLLSFATMVAFLIVVCVVLRWQKTALLLALVWGVLTAMTHNGYSAVLGPLAVVAAVTGFFLEFLRPRRPAGAHRP